MEDPQAYEKGTNQESGQERDDLVDHADTCRRKGRGPEKTEWGGPPGPSRRAMNLPPPPRMEGDPPLEPARACWQLHAVAVLTGLRPGRAQRLRAAPHHYPQGS